jgi:hypothetical protein
MLAVFVLAKVINTFEDNPRQIPLMLAPFKARAINYDDLSTLYFLTHHKVGFLNLMQAEFWRQIVRALLFP